jgi:uncharacterized membrane protein
MNQILQFPSWNTLHPLIIHFPIVLLLIAPLFILAGVLLRKERGRFALISALILMLLGTASSYVAQATGEAAAKSAQEGAQIRAVLKQHEELAETTATVFSVLSVVYAIIVLAPIMLRRETGPMVRTALPLVFLIFYSAGIVILVNTAHQGGRLVHELGLRAGMKSTAPVVSNAVSPRNSEGD